MNDPTLITDLMQIVARLVSALSADVRGQNADSADTRREADRERKRVKRELARVYRLSAKANDVAECPQKSAEVSADKADNRCDLLPSLSSSVSVEREERKKERGNARTRGTRLTAGLAISAADFQFARDQHMEPMEVSKAWVEFIDYWIGVPGQRGTKLDWSATWRNRVRQLATKGSSNGKSKRSGSLLDALDRLEIGDGDTGGAADILRLPPR